VGGDPTELIPRQGPGEVAGPVHVRKAGRYEVWLDGSIGQGFVVWVGRKYVGSISNELGPPGQWNRIGTVTLAAGAQPALIRREPMGLSPGADDANPNNRLLGPLTLVPAGYQPTVDEIAPAQAKRLCGRSVNWIEVVR
jgi:hypothetical protein